MDSGKAVAAALITALFIKLVLLDFMVTEGQSMTPSISDGALLVVNKAAYGVRLPGASRYLVRWASPRRGDVVVFYTPQGSLALKRCAAVEDGYLLLLGDNQEVSFDSRAYGLVAMDRVVGKVLVHT